MKICPTANVNIGGTTYLIGFSAARNYNAQHLQPHQFDMTDANQLRQCVLCNAATPRSSILKLPCLQTVLISHFNRLRARSVPKSQSSQRAIMRKETRTVYIIE